MFTIEQKSDILIPFEKIGDENWKENTFKILKERRSIWNEEKKSAKTEKEIRKLEQKLKTKLPKGLQLFYLNFGIADIGEQLQDFKDVNRLHTLWNETLIVEYFSKKEIELLPYLISFSDYLGNGNMFCFHAKTKEVYYYDHDTKPYLTKMFTTVDDYIKACLMFYQFEFCNAENQDKAMNLCESFLIKMYGLKTIKKWMY